MLKLIEQRVVPWLLIALISGGVLMYREMGEVKTMVIAIQGKIRDTDSESRDEIRRLNGMIVNHERRPHGRMTE